jgi:8-oxo-dGTP diphosphatase/2-hydroxy-dATP diphosphatase
MIKSEKPIKQTLVIVQKGISILLGAKKRGFGKGKWNGFGGKVKLGEKIEDGAKRELLEEAFIKAEKIEKVGLIEFESRDKPGKIRVYVFRVDKFSGEPKESEEMFPKWFNVREIPYLKMWPDDIYWLPLLLKGKKFKGKFLFDKNENIIRKELEEFKGKCLR